MAGILQTHIPIEEDIKSDAGPSAKPTKNDHEAHVHLEPTRDSSTHSSKHRREFTFRGHRRESYVAVDTAELVELRARQRTFDGAYMRTSLGNLTYSVVVLRLFDTRFYYVGLLYAILAASFAIIAYARRRYSDTDFSDQTMPRPQSTIVHDRHRSNNSQGQRVFGRPFVTAGRIVVASTGVIATVQIALLVLLAKLD